MAKTRRVSKTQPNETVSNHVSHGVIPKDIRKLRFNPFFFNISIALELPFSVQLRFRLRPLFPLEVCNTVLQTPFTAKWWVDTPGPHWTLHIPGVTAGIPSLASGPLSSYCCLS